MSVRHGLLAILDTGPRHGYQLKTEIEARTGHTWTVNIGQIYSTLARMERDGLIERSDGGAETQIAYRITDAGRDVVRAWFDTPVASRDVPRDELTVKVMLSLATGRDPLRVIQVQRTAVMRTLQEYTRLKTQADDDAELAWLATLDYMIVQAEAQARWLDLAEARIMATGAGASAGPMAATGATTPSADHERQTAPEVAR